MAFGWTSFRHKQMMLMGFEDARHYLTASEGHLGNGKCRAALMALRHANRAFARGRSHENAFKHGKWILRADERAAYEKSLPQHLDADLGHVEEQILQRCGRK